jgi:hypothetical protein
MTTKHEALQMAMDMRKAYGVHYLDEQRPFKLIEDGPVPQDGLGITQFIQDASEALASSEARLQ